MLLLLAQVAGVADGLLHAVHQGHPLPGRQRLPDLLVHQQRCGGKRVVQLQAVGRQPAHVPPDHLGQILLKGVHRAHQQRRMHIVHGHDLLGRHHAIESRLKHRDPGKPQPQLPQVRQGPHRCAGPDVPEAVPKIPQILHALGFHFLVHPLGLLAVQQRQGLLPGGRPEGHEQRLRLRDQGREIAAVHRTELQPAVPDGLQRLALRPQRSVFVQLNVQRLLPVGVDPAAKIAQDPGGVAIPAEGRRQLENFHLVWDGVHLLHRFRRPSSLRPLRQEQAARQHQHAQGYQPAAEPGHSIAPHTLSPLAC